MNNSTTIKESILKLLNLTEKEEIAQELSNILGDYKSYVVMSIQREYILRDFETNEYVASDWFVSPPLNGDFYRMHNAIYEVIQVTHSYRPSSESGTIQVKKVRELKPKN